jgi:hypothetical protein
MLDRRKLLVGATALAGYSALARAAGHTSGRRYRQPMLDSSPASASGSINSFVGGQAPNIHGVIIVRRGRVVFEKLFRGRRSGAGRIRASAF